MRLGVVASVIGAGVGMVVVESVMWEGACMFVVESVMEGGAVSYTRLRADVTSLQLVCRLQRDKRKIFTD